jgi:hypothetical protein
MLELNRTGLPEAEGGDNGVRVCLALGTKTFTPVLFRRDGCE